MLAIYGRVLDVDEVVAKIDAVTTADVRRFAGAVTEAGAALTLYGPAGAAPDLDTVRARLRG